MGSLGLPEMLVLLVVGGVAAALVLAIRKVGRSRAGERSGTRIPEAEWPSLTRGHRKQLRLSGIGLILLGYAGQIAFAVVPSGQRGVDLALPGSALLVLFGCGLLAKSKGRSAAWGLFGILSCIGLVVIASLDNHAVVAEEFQGAIGGVGPASAAPRGSGASIAERKAKVAARSEIAEPGKPPGPELKGEASTTELAFWDSIKASDDPKDFEAYLERYPDGVFAGLARNRLR
jgi:hypothetical protein